MDARTRARLDLVRWLDGHASRERDTTPDMGAGADAWLHKHVLAPLAYRRGLSRFRADYATTAIMAELAAARLTEVVAALTEARIDVILLKGIAYASDLYADPGERPMADIDLLVRPGQRTAAERIMQALGYTPAAASRFHHAAMYTRGNHEVFDIHSAIVSPWRSRIDLDAVWQRARKVDGATRLDPVDEALFHFVGMARGAMLEPLILYIDAARLLRRLDPAQLVQLRSRARGYHVQRAVTAGLFLTEQLIGNTCSPAPPRPAWLPESWLQDVVDGAEPRSLELVKRKLVLADGPRQRLGHIVQWLLEQPGRWSGRMTLGT